MSGATPQNQNGVDKRVAALEAAFAVQGSQISGLASDMASMKGSIQGMVDGFGAMKATVLEMSVSRGTMNVKSLVGVIGTVLMVGGVIWAAIRLQVSADMSAIVSEQAISRTERSENRQQTSIIKEDLYQRLEKIEGFNSETRSKVDLADLKFREMEGQLDKERKIRNIDKANHIREFSPIYEKVTGMRYPSEVQYYPETTAPDYRK